MSRFEGDKINVGNSFIINSDSRSDLNKEIVDAKLIADSIIADAKNRANVILNQANQKAGEMVTQASMEAEASKDAVTADARKQGYEEGYAEGQERIVTEMEDLVFNINNFAKCKFDIKNRIIKSLHTDILEMVIDISEKICKTQLKENRQSLLNLVINAVQQLKEKENVTIIVHPEMSKKIYEISDGLKEAIHNLENIKIIEDNSVSADGTIVESVGSRVDARVSAQIEQLAQKLFAELNSIPEIELSRELDDVDGMNDKPESI